jgi:stage II sporulation protein D
MRKLIFSLIVFVLASLLLQVSALGQELRSVKIGLALDQVELTLDPMDLGGILDLAGSSTRPLPLPGDLITVTVSGEMLFINGIPISSGPLAVMPGSQNLTWSGRSYRGIFLITTQNGKINLINQLLLEEYLQGVVPKEVIPEWPMAALKAQAIAARTFTAASLGRHGARFDLCATTHCQVYGGVTAEHPNTNLAVVETAGKVITYNGKIISAFYHAASGGMTDDAANIWMVSSPYLKPVIEWDQSSPWTQWTRSYNWTELQGIAVRDFPQIGRLTQVLPVSFESDGKRILRLKLKGDTGEVFISGEQFRYSTGIPSSQMQMGIIYGPEPFITLWWTHNLFPEALTANNEIPGLAADLLNPPWDLPDPWAWLQDKEPVKMVLRGAGWGHGVGLSQWGARGMSDNGFNERQILEHYYPGSIITSLDKLKSIKWR